MNQTVQQRRDHVDKANGLSITQQSNLLKIHRSGFYYRGPKESEFNLELMSLIEGTSASSLARRSQNDHLA